MMVTELSCTSCVVLIKCCVS